MKGSWRPLAQFFSLAILMAPGCVWNDHLKPPTRPEEYKLPPMEDKRFSQPVQFPKGTLNPEPIKKATSNDKSKPGFRPGGSGGNPGN
ncbi:MAG: hypothetical protein EXR99_01245 [Gemmataceae bacterium]|nr:hypothetical protein [Gemmataceae bacterium]